MKTVLLKVENNIAIILITERDADLEIVFILQEKILRLLHFHRRFSIIGQLLLVINAWLSTHLLFKLYLSSHFSSSHGKLREVLISLTCWNFSLGFLSAWRVESKIMDHLERADWRGVFLFFLHAFEQIILIKREMLRIIKDFDLKYNFYAVNKFLRQLTW